jgi:hypothetical protein
VLPSIIEAVTKGYQPGYQPAGAQKFWPSSLPGISYGPYGPYGQPQVPWLRGSAVS